MKSMKLLGALALALASTYAAADLDKILPASKYDVKVERGQRIAGDEHLQGQIDAQGTRLDKTNQRVDAVAYTTNSNTARLGKVEDVNKAQDARLDKTSQRVDAVAWTTNSNTTRIGKVEGRTAGLEARADDADLLLADHGNQLGSHSGRLDGHDQQLANQDVINAAVGSSLAGLYQDTSALRSEVRQARREAKEAKAYGTIALAVAGHQFNTEPSAGFQMALSASTIGGHQGYALGAGGAINEKLFVNVGLATSGSETGGVLSGTYTFGR